MCRPKLAYAGVTEVGYPVSLIIVEPPHHDEVDPFPSSINDIRSNGEIDRLLNEPDPSEDRPSNIISNETTEQQLLVYVPFKKASKVSADQETSEKHRIARTKLITNGPLTPPSKHGNHLIDGDLNTTEQQTQNPCESAPSSHGLDHSLNLQIPPFLSWATHRDRSLVADDPSSRTSSEHMERILESIHITLSDKWKGRNQRIYRISLRLCRDELEKAHPFLKEQRSNADEKTRSPSDNVLEGIRIGESTENDFEIGEVVPKDAIHVELLKRCNKANTELFRIFETLLSFYLPLSSNHTVIQKCWGAFDTILSVRWSH